MKIPFSRQNLVGTNQLQMIERAMVVDEMPIHFDAGATIDLDYQVCSDQARFLLRAGAFNGRGDKVYAADNNDNLMYVGRLRVDLINPPSPGEGDRPPVSFPKAALAEKAGPGGPSLSLGASFLQNNDVDRIVKAWGADAEFRWYGVSISGEMIATKYLLELEENLISDNQYGDDWSTFGWYVQGGVFVWPRWVELAARYEEYRLELVDQSASERKLADTTGGLNFHFISEHALKLMANYVWRAELKSLPDMDNDSFSLQAGFMF